MPTRVAQVRFLHQFGFAAVVVFEFQQQLFHFGAQGFHFGAVTGGYVFQPQHELMEFLFELIVFPQQCLHFFRQAGHLLDRVGHVAVLLFQCHQSFQVTLERLGDEP